MRNKTVIIFLFLNLILLSLTCCVENVIYEKGFSPDGLNPVTVIPDNDLEGWDNGYILDRSYSYLVKNRAEGGFYACFNDLKAEKMDYVLFNLDNRYRVGQIMTKTECLFLYYTDETTVVYIYNISTQKSSKKTFTDTKTVTVPKGGVSEPDASVCETILKGVQSTLDLVSGSVKESMLNVICDLLSDDSQAWPELVSGALIHSVSDSDKKHFLEYSKVVKLSEQSDDYRQNVEQQSFGQAGVRVEKVDNHKVTVRIDQSQTIPIHKANNLIYGLEVTQIGLDKSKVTGSETFITYSMQSSAGKSQLVFDIDKTELGWYLLKPYIKDTDMIRYGENYWYFCGDLDKMPDYTIDRLSFNSMGKGKVEISFRAVLKPLTGYSELSQLIEFNSSSGAYLFSIGTQPYSTSFSPTIEATIEDFNADCSAFKADYVLNPTFKYYCYDGQSPIVSEKKLPAKTLIYEEKPVFDLVSVSLGTTLCDTVSDLNGNKKLVYRTAFSMKYSVEGSFWIKDVSFKMNKGSAILNMPELSLAGNGTYITRGEIEYETTSAISFVAEPIVTILDGSVLPQSKKLSFSGNNNINEVSIK